MIKDIEDKIKNRMGIIIMQLSNEDRYSKINELEKDLEFYREILKEYNEIICTLCEPYDIMNAKLVSRFYTKNVDKKAIKAIVKEVRK